MGIKVLGLLLALVAGAAYGRPGYGSISLGSGQGGVKGNAGFVYSGTKTLGSGARGYVDISTNDLGGNAELHGSGNQIAGVTNNSDLLGAVNGNLGGSNHVNGEAHSEADAGIGGSRHGNRDSGVLATNLGGYGANSNASSDSNVAGHSGESNDLGDGDSHGFVDNVHKAIHIGHIHGTRGSNSGEVGVSLGSNSVLAGLSLGGNTNQEENGTSGNSVLRGGNVGHTNQEASGLNLGGNGILNAHSYGRRDQSAAGDTGSSDLVSVVNGSFSSSTGGYHDHVDGEAAHSVTQEARSNSVLGGHGSGSNLLTGISLGGYGANSNGSSETHANVDVGHNGGSNLLGDVSLTGHGDHSHGSVGNDVQEAGQVSHGSNNVIGLGLGGNTNGAANGEGGHGSNQSSNGFLYSFFGRNDQASGDNLGGNSKQNSSGNSGNNAVATQEGRQGVAQLDLNRPYSNQDNHSHGRSGRGPYRGHSYPSSSGLGTHSHHSYPSSSGFGTHSPHRYPSSRGYGSHTYPSSGGISTLDNTFASNGVSYYNHEISGSLSQVSHGNNSVLSLGGETNGARNGGSSQGSSPSGHSVLGLNVGHNDQETSGLHFGRIGNQHSSGTSGNNAIAIQEGSQGAAQVDFYRRYDNQSPYGNRIPYSSPLYHPSTTKLPPFGDHVHGNGGYSTPSPQGIQVYPSKGGISTSDNTFASNSDSDNGYVPVTGHSHGCFSYPLPRSGNGSDWYGSSDHAYQAGQGGIRFSNSPGFTSHGYGSRSNAVPVGQGEISGSFSNSPGFTSHGYGSRSNAVPAGQGGVSGSVGNWPGFTSHGYGSGSNAVPAAQGGISNSPGFTSHGYGSGSNAVPAGQGEISGSFSNSPGYGSHGHSFSGSVNADHDE